MPPASQIDYSITWKNDNFTVFFFLLRITLNFVLFLLALELVESWYIIEAIVGIHISFLIVMGLFLGFDL